MEPYKREFLEHAHKIHALKFGIFNLKSGRKSPYFFNAGEFSTGSSLLELGKAYAKTLAEKQYQVEICILYGPAYKGINLVAATAIAYGLLFEKEISFCSFFISCIKFYSQFPRIFLHPVLCFLQTTFPIIMNDLFPKPYFNLCFSF